MTTDILMGNYFFRDYITEDIASIVIYKTYLYFYKETLVGVRDTRAVTGFFLDVKTVPKSGSIYAPTLDDVTEQNIKDCIDELEHSQETITFLPIAEIVPKAQELVSMELSHLLDERMMA
jgi:hypothetical protein